MGKTGEKQIGNRNVREMKEGRDPQSFLSPPLNKIRVFNWSKLLCFLFFDLFLFFFFYFFLFWLCGFLALCSFVESLLLVNMPLDFYLF